MVSFTASTGKFIDASSSKADSFPGDVIYDQFEDSNIRTELDVSYLVLTALFSTEQTRLAYLKPAELLVPKSGLSDLTETVVKQTIKYT